MKSLCHCKVQDGGNPTSKAGDTGQKTQTLTESGFLATEKDQGVAWREVSNERKDCVLGPEQCQRSPNAMKAVERRRRDSSHQSNANVLCLFPFVLDDAPGA